MDISQNITELKKLFLIYKKQPNELSGDWISFFDDLDEDAVSFLLSDSAEKTNVSQSESSNIKTTALDAIRARLLIRSFRVLGHLEANLDPLGIAEKQSYQELDPLFYGFKEEDLNRNIFLDGVFGLEKATMKEIIKKVRSIYCGKLGFQYMHIQDPEQRRWLQQRIESEAGKLEFTDNGRKAILERLTAAEAFEKFLDRKYTGTKRFGIEGGESLIPALEQILKYGGKLGVEEVIVGMPHRGRLNVLANFMGKPFEAIFSEFQGNSSNPSDVQGSGDVKYHLGTSSDRTFDGNTIHLSLTANPSHLEAVNPVVIGKVRAKQEQKNDSERKKVIALIMHGDAAFSGQGLVPETLDMSELKGYKIGGTIHFIVNNQIGFTTNPINSRSGPYCSDVALMIQAPILHVNGDDPEAVVYASRIAIEFRQKFNKDVVVDMFCYRRQGHNEGDEPSFTQPLMYKAIAKLPTTRNVYINKLVNEGMLTKEECEQIYNDWVLRLEKNFETSKNYKPNKADWLEGSWSGFKDSLRKEESEFHNTSIDNKILKKLSNELNKEPAGYVLNKKIIRQLENRKKAIDSGKGIDWASSESLAFASLLYEGFNVRLSGQDCGRGTFSQRHAVMVDQNTEDRYVPLENISNDKSFEVIDSPLSEAAVLGFEYGYTLAEPNTLVMWEAQFGDFANSAQMIIDQFIVSGESKWLRMSGLVLLLPHGYEGQGPEHSSARLERFLQLCAEKNIQIVNCTTPANYFHVLRRQIHRSFRKPLVVFTPKSLLRNKQAVSSINEFTKDKFNTVIGEKTELATAKKIKKIILC